ncbi:hypothetical protein HOD38_01255 [archaeon]|jgi:hypothetical protein|nr:hypothetical protein [archaeon]MBT4396872.1 hypothetical protein [archaeon]MBT4441450.1 hypothetical protein [archaeon]
MKKWVHKVEVIVDWIIPFAVLILLGVIIVELFFHDFAETYHLAITIIDATVIGIFVIDLIFKWIRIRHIKPFIKECWLDIIAVFPFFLVFRVVERFLILLELSGDIKQFQMLFHEGLELRKSGSSILKEGGKIVQEAEKAGKLSRVQQIVRYIKPIQRSPRLLKALPFFEKPSGKHHIHKSILNKKKWWGFWKK